MCDSNLKSPSLYKHETLKQSTSFHCQGQDDTSTIKMLPTQ